MKKLFKKDNNKGFTLMEMIIVIAIIAILIALVAPNLISYLNTATDTKVAGNAKTCYTSANAWVAQLKIDGKSSPDDKTMLTITAKTTADDIKAKVADEDAAKALIGSLQNATWGTTETCYIHFNQDGVCDAVKYVSDKAEGYYPTTAEKDATISWPK
ncbi:MAG: prepilin-type N-terminal cleavage/methylation domain-containing protein [Lachnospiraceae bacterium]|nr:prepilin-type N-terminal cleavage/methylation domain-containing protein [Lachnospiraceae bacterium]